jgi:hypothetical protein
MIQRKQTLFLLLAFIALVVCSVMHSDSLLMRILAACTAVAAAGNIFVYNHRPLQAGFCVGIMALCVVYYILLAVNQPLLEWYMTMPLVAVFFVFLARQGIVKDEKLVRSLDRIR